MQQSRQQMFEENMNKLVQIGKDQSTIGRDILSGLWNIYKLSLWKTEQYNSQHYESFRAMTEFIGTSSYEDPDYFFDFSNIVERVFVYVNLRKISGEPVKNPLTGEIVTVDMLIEKKGWIGKLISISQGIEDCKDDDEIDELFDAAFKGTREDVKNKGNEMKEKRIPIKIPVNVSHNGDGSVSVMALNISPEQSQLLIKKLGQTIELHLD
jgi:hypothetical protein